MEFCCRDGRSLVRRLAGLARRFLRASRVRLPSRHRRGGEVSSCRNAGGGPKNRCSWQSFLWIDPLWLAGNRLREVRARVIRLRRRSRRISGRHFRVRPECVLCVPGIPSWRVRVMLLRGRSTGGRLGNCSGLQSTREMILVCVGERDYIEFFVAARPEVGRYGVFTAIDSTVFLATRETVEGAAGVDQQGLSLRRDHEDGVALAYVEEGCRAIPALKTPSRPQDNRDTALAGISWRNTASRIPAASMQAATLNPAIRKMRDVAELSTSGHRPRAIPQVNAAAIATAGNFTEHVSAAPEFRCGRFAGRDRTGGLR
jgi:hypothetical protein